MRILLVAAVGCQRSEVGW